MKSPSRNGSVTDHGCAVCTAPLPAGRPRTTCSDRCRQAAWRRRHQPATDRTPQPLPDARTRKAGTVYECPACDAKALGQQRCDCGSFMRRLGRGALSPCCGEPITVEELLAGN